MIVFRYLFFIVLIGLAAWGLWHAVRYIVGTILESNKEKIRVRLAKEQKEDELDKKKADLKIAEIKKRTLYDEETEKTGKDAVKESVAITKSKLTRLAKKFSVEENELLYRLDGRVEWVCEHGVGHTIWHPRGSDSVHGCDGCCRKFAKIRQKKKK